jgi:hypothetical protein
MFWCRTILKYALVGLGAIVISFLVVLCLLVFVIAPHDDSPALGIAWFMFSVLLAALLVPLSLGFTAEIVERGVQHRPFRWLRAFVRALLAVPITFAPVYGYFQVLMLRPDARDMHWAAKLMALSGLATLFGILALRIKRTTDDITDSGLSKA